MHHWKVDQYFLFDVVLCTQSATARRLPCLWLVILLLIPLPAQQRLATVPGMLAAPNPRSETPPGHWFIVSKSHLIHSRFCGNEWNCIQNHTRPGGELCSIVQCLFPTISHVCHRISFSRFGTWITEIILSPSRNPSTICPTKRGTASVRPRKDAKWMTSKALVLGGSAGGPWVLKSYSWAVVCRFHDTLIDPCHPCKEGKNTTTQNEVNLSKSFSTISKSINYQSYWASELCVSCIIKQHLRHIFGSKNGTHQLVLNGVDNGMIRKHHQWVQNSTTMTCIFLDFHTMVTIHPPGPSPQQSVCQILPNMKSKGWTNGIGMTALWIFAWA